MVFVIVKSRSIFYFIYKLTGLLDITELWPSTNGAEHYELLERLQNSYSLSIVRQPSLTGLFVAYISITCGSTTQWITLCSLICGSATLWEMWVLWVSHLPPSVTVAFRDTRILSALAVDNPVECSFQGYQNPDKFKSRRSCSFHSYVTPRRRYISRQV